MKKKRTRHQEAQNKNFQENEANSVEERPRICGIMFKESKDDDYSFLGELCLTEEEENAIQQILMNHETEGCSVRGTWKEVIEEITR